MEIVNDNAVLRHDFLSNGVVLDLVAYLAASLAFWHHGGGCPDELSSCFFELSDQLFQIFFILVKRNR